ncbi:MAG: carbohydrate binding family 9 domain-containing protein [Ignavibacteria bacterium]|nr:carbohydrate binding family 9 domain-containing protein [Ignavibacteria bacterium]
MRHYSQLFLFMLSIAAYSSLGAYQSTNKNRESYVLQAVRIDRNLSLSGNLSDPLWKLAMPVELPFEIQPGDNLPSRQKTTARVLYNNEYLYFGFDCADTDLTQLRAHISDRDRMFNDDFVVVILDVYGDSQRAYQFFANPHGIQGDIMRTGNNEDSNFDTVFDTEAEINATGWKAEMAIPFKSLRFPPKPEQEWIILIGRNYPRESEYIFSWHPLDRNNPCLVCQGGRLTGIRDVESFTTFDLLPYVIGMQSGALRDDSDPATFETGAVRGRVGGGIRYAPNPDLSLEGVINPDFSQVETDAAQISVNTTYALFYPERRPFFLAGSEQFRTRLNMFHSRMINNPLAAAKFSSKTGKLSVSYLSALDRESPFIVPGQEGSSSIRSSLRSYANIVRTRYDFGNQSSIGAMVTARNFSDAHNYVGGIDWNYFFGGNYTLRGQAVYAYTKEPNDRTLFSNTRRFGSTEYTAAFDGQEFSGTALDVELEREAETYSFEISYRDISPTFQTQNGFVTRNDQRFVRFDHQVMFYPDNGILDRARIFHDGGFAFNHEGIRRDLWMSVGGSLEFKSQTRVALELMLINKERFRGVHFPNIERVEFDISTRPISSFSMWMDAEFGKFIYRSRVPETGTGHELSAGTTIKPTSQLAIDLSYSRSRLTSIARGNLLYDGYIARTTTVYQFTRSMFLRLIAEYDSFDKAVNVFPLFSYKLNPFTIFYAGSTANLRNFPGQEPHEFSQTERQYFVKFQYLLRY